MNCPQCGLPTLPQQKFCRSCGAGLQMITQPLAAHDSLFEPERKPANISRAERPRANLVLWAFIMMFIGVAIGVIGKKLMHSEIVTVVGALVSIAGMFLVSFPFLSPPPRKRHDDASPSLPGQQKKSQPPKHLPHGSEIAYASSVTERTTDLLEVPATTRAEQKTDAQSQVE